MSQVDLSEVVSVTGKCPHCRGWIEFAFDKNDSRQLKQVHISALTGALVERHLECVESGSVTLRDLLGTIRLWSEPARETPDQLESS